MDVPSNRITRLIFRESPIRARMDAFEEVAWQTLAGMGDGLLP